MDISTLLHAGNLDMQDCSSADIALSLCRMVSYNVAQVCCSNRQCAPTQQRTISTGLSSWAEVPAYILQQRSKLD